MLNSKIEFENLVKFRSGFMLQFYVVWSLQLGIAVCGWNCKLIAAAKDSWACFDDISTHRIGRV